MITAVGMRSRGVRFLARHRSFVTDLVISLLILLAVAAFAASANNPYRKDFRKATFYERNFAPAVMIACGLGYVAPEIVDIIDLGAEDVRSREGELFSYPITTVPELNDFLLLRTPSFSCDSLPPDLQTYPAAQPQPTERYSSGMAISYPNLMRTVGLIWSIRGVSWGALAPLFGLLCGLVTALSYALFRLASGRFLALAGVVLFFPLHLVHLQYLRDYAKAPFFLAVLLIFGAIIKRPFGRATFLGLSALAGLLVGVGGGYRPDSLICLPPFLIVLACMPRADRTHWATKSAAAGIFLLGFLVAGQPFLRYRNSSSPPPSFAIQGLARPFSDELGIESSLYEWAPLYADSWVDFEIRSHAFLGMGDVTPLTFLEPPYSSAASRLLLDTLLLFPADALTRSYGAVLQIVVLPFLGALLFLLVGASQPRLAIGASLLVLYFSVYPMLQFAERHYFFLRFLPFWLAALALQLAAGRIHHLVRELVQDFSRETLLEQLRALRSWWNRSKTRLLALAAGAGVCLLLPLPILRAYQSHRLGELFEAYIQAEVSPLAPKQVELDEERVRVEGFDEEHLVRLPTNKHWEMAAGYLVADFSAQDCSETEVPIIVRHAFGGKKNFSRTLEVDLSQGGVTRLFTPIYATLRSPYPVTDYQWGASAFLGLEMDAVSADCLVGLYRLVDLERFPPFLHLQLPPDWRRLKRYQTIRGAGKGTSVRRLINISLHRWGRIRAAA